MYIGNPGPCHTDLVPNSRHMVFCTHRVQPVESSGLVHPIVTDRRILTLLLTTLPRIDQDRPGIRAGFLFPSFLRPGLPALWNATSASSTQLSASASRTARARLTHPSRQPTATWAQRARFLFHPSTLLCLEKRPRETKNKTVLGHPAGVDEQAPGRDIPFVPWMELHRPVTPLLVLISGTGASGLFRWFFEGYAPVFHVFGYGPDEVFAGGPAAASGPRLHGQDDREAHLGLRDGARDVGVFVHAENLHIQMKASGRGGGYLVEKWCVKEEGRAIYSLSWCWLVAIALVHPPPFIGSVGARTLSLTPECTVEGK